MKADTQTEAEVMGVLKQYNEAYAKRDLEGILGLFAPDPDVVVIGTGLDEKRIGLAEIKTQFQRDFTQSQEASIEFDWYSVSMEGSVAWVAADCVAHVKTTDGQEVELSARSTAVLEKREGKWLIVQMHASVPAAEQNEGQSFPT